MTTPRDLTAQQETHVRGALHFLRARCGTWALTGKLLNFKESSLGNIAAGRKPVSAAIVLRIARVAKVGVDDLLGGRFPAPGTCPHCGQTLPTTETQPSLELS
jgi:hypothetical protein